MIKSKKLLKIIEFYLINDFLNSDYFIIDKTMLKYIEDFGGNSEIMKIMNPIYKLLEEETP